MNKKTIREISSNLLIFVGLITGYSIVGILKHNYIWLLALIPSITFMIWHFYNIISEEIENGQKK